MHIRLVSREFRIYDRLSVLRLRTDQNQLCCFYNYPDSLNRNEVFLNVRNIRRKVHLVGIATKIRREEN